MNQDWDIPLVCSVLTGRRLQHWRRGSKNGKLFFDGFSFCIMAEASQYRPIPELDLSGPAHVVAERWRRWKRSFDLYIAGQDIDDATRKHSLLLHYAGMNVQDLFETLTEPAQPEDRYAKTIAMLDGQFKVAKNTPFERHVFRQMCPEANEPIDKFVARLRQQARLCEYSDLDDQLRDQLLDKIAQPGLRRKLLEKEDMTPDDALKICRSWESTAHQTAQMSSSATSSATTTTVHAAAHSSQQQRRKWNQPRTPYLTHSLPRIALSPCQRFIRGMSAQSELATKREFLRLKGLPLHRWFSQHREEQASLRPCSWSVWPLCWLRSGRSRTAWPWPGFERGCHSACWDRRLPAFAVRGESFGETTWKFTLSLLLGKPGCKCHDFQSTLLWPGVSSFPQFLLVPSLALVALPLLSLSLSLSLSLCLSRRPVLWIFIRSSVGSPFPFSLFLFLLSFLFGRKLLNLKKKKKKTEKKKKNLVLPRTVRNRNARTVDTGNTRQANPAQPKAKLASNAASGIISAGSASQAEVPDGPTQHDHSHGDDISYAQVMHTTSPTEMTRERTTATTKPSSRWDSQLLRHPEYTSESATAAGPPPLSTQELPAISLARIASRHSANRAWR